MHTFSNKMCIKTPCIYETHVKDQYHLLGSCDFINIYIYIHTQTHTPPQKYFTLQLYAEFQENVSKTESFFVCKLKRFSNKYCDNADQKICSEDFSSKYAITGH